MNNKNKLSLTLILIAITALFFWKIVSLPFFGLSEPSSLEAQGGIIDASKWNFESRGPLPLKGEWRFYHHLLLSPESLASLDRLDPQKDALLQVPGIWNWESDDYPAESFGSYVLRLILPGDTEQVALYIEEVASSFVLYANGKKILQNGRVGTSLQNSSAAVRPRICFLSLDSPDLTLILQVSNFQATKGGIRMPPLAGTPEQILNRHTRETAADLFLFGGIFVIAVYQFGLSFFRKLERRSLYFSLFCAMIALRGILTGSRFFQFAFPVVPHEIYNSLEFISAYGAAYFYYHYHTLKFPDESWSPFLTISRLVTGFFVLSAVVMPIRQHARLILFFEGFVVVEIILILGGLVLGVIRKRPEAVAYTAGFTILFLSILHDILHYNLLIGNTYLLHYGLLFFILLHSFLLSYRFAAMEQRAITYAESLESRNNDLADRIRKKRDPAGD